jgi:hypothetical protein
MPIDRNDGEERQARLDTMIEEFRAAQQRRRVKAQLVLTNQTAAAQRAMACAKEVPRDKVH